MKKTAALGLSFLALSAFAKSRLINGHEVTTGTYTEVIQIRAESTNAKCTATVVGPRVIITAAHCTKKDGGVSLFTIGGTDYSANMTRSPIYPGKDHDVAVGITAQPITGVTPASIGGNPQIGNGVLLLGYGCTVPEGGTSDNKLRIGDSAIIGFEGLDVVSKKDGGAALCFGDSGGPTFMQEGSQRFLIGINSKGDMVNMNKSAHLGLPDSKTFLQDMAQKHSVEICGINKDCGSPQPGKPTCILAVNPSTFKKGESSVVSIATAGQVTSAKINGTPVTFPSGTLQIKGTQVGTFMANGEVSGPGGTGNCQASFNVTDGGPDPAPSCTLTAVPPMIKLGGSVSLELSVLGNATSATIEGTSVSVVGGKKAVTPTTEGNYTASASVTGPGGLGACTTSYEVTKDPIDPTVPNFAVVSAYCGDNTLATDVTKVCLGVVKKDATFYGLRVTHAFMVYLKDGGREVLPIIATSSTPPKPGDLTYKEELTTYTSNLIPAGNYLVMDTRRATLTKTVGRDRKRTNDTPVSVEGRSASGKYFIVERMNTPGMIQLPGEG